MDTETQMLRRELDELRRKTTEDIDRLHHEMTKRALEENSFTEARMRQLHLRMDELQKEMLARIDSVRKEALDNYTFLDARVFDLCRETIALTGGRRSF